MAKKYYAVFGGKEGNAIYSNWDDTLNNTKSVSNVKFKSFASVSEAEDFIISFGADITSIKRPYKDGSVQIIVCKKTDVKKEKVSKNLLHGELLAYVDGSYRTGYTAYGYGVVLLKDGEILKTLSGFGNKEKYLSMRNVAGEVLGSIKAMDWAINNGYKRLHIFFDYTGIEFWATGKWKRNNELTAGYHNYVAERKDILELVFHKVSGHSGDKYNDMADALAKEAVEKSKGN